jgi:uncharacterized protein (TIGR02646 family)
MKPVDKGKSPGAFADYGEAKPELVARLGKSCSYCEAFGEPAGLDVEHIYPKDPHPTRAKIWDNFLLSCKSCNSKKAAYLGNGKQRGLNERYLWPHLDNTMRALRYLKDGRVAPAPRVSPAVRKLAEATIAMVGSLSSPAAAKSYEKMAIAYSGVSLREEIWAMVEGFKNDYLADPTAARAHLFAKGAVRQGYFSIWMAVFKDRPEFRRELIKEFKADPNCFDGATRPVRKGRV